MDWNASTWWWLLAGMLVAAELATGTFYLLMVALGAGAGAVAAHTGMSATGQMVAAAVVGLATTGAWHWRRLRHPPVAPAEFNRDVNLDIGQQLHVPLWQADGTARVSYRGAQWSVRLAKGAVPTAGGDFQIVAIQGSELLLAPVTAPTD